MEKKYTKEKIRFKEEFKDIILEEGRSLEDI